MATGVIVGGRCVSVVGKDDNAVDQTPIKPSFQPSEMDSQFAAARGDAASVRRRGNGNPGGRRGRNIGIGLAVGVIIGLIIGVVFGNFIVGIVIGVIIGAAIGFMMDR